MDLTPPSMVGQTLTTCTIRITGPWWYRTLSTDIVSPVDELQAVTEGCSLKSRLMALNFNARSTSGGTIHFWHGLDTLPIGLAKLLSSSQMFLGVQSDLYLVAHLLRSQSINMEVQVVIVQDGSTFVRCDLHR
jgi:hypothetical protein